MRFSKSSLSESEFPWIPFLFSSVYFYSLPSFIFDINFSIYLLLLVPTPVPQCTSGGHRAHCGSWCSPFTEGRGDQAQVVRLCHRSLCLWSQLKEASAWTSSVKQMGDLKDPMIVSHERSSVLGLHAFPLCGPSPVWVMPVISRKEKAEHCFISSLT